MATILFAWELGANLGHLIPIARTAAALGGSGHKYVYAVRDLMRAESVLGAGSLVFQAPMWPRHVHFGPTAGGLASYADILTAIGFGDAAKISAVAGGWTALVDAIKPDLVVTDHSPGLQVALYGTGTRTVAIGSGFTMPPLDYDHFPRLRGDRAPVVPETRLFAALRNAQSARGQPLPGNLIDAFRSDRRVVFGIPELDPYRSFRKEPMVAPPGGLPPPMAWPRQHRLFVYVGDDVENFEVLIQALATLDVEVEAYLRGEIGSAADFLRMRGATVHEAPPPLEEVLGRASHVLTQGGAMTAAAVFTAGRPHLVIPTHDEADTNLELLLHAGVAARMKVSVDVDLTVAALKRFLDDRTLPDKALEQANRLGARRLADGAEVAADAIRAALV